MTTFITSDQVDEVLGSSWASDQATKNKAVLKANAYMTSLRLTNFDPTNIPQDMINAGAYIASVASSGQLFAQKENSGVVLSSMVKADGVETTETYAGINTENESLLPDDLQFALALLSSYRSNPLAFNIFR